ncbi:MAG: L,D-transpeptidase family protein [Candidatus Pacebacteria bacterium]|nr:L,D-transpeptidase family protein [Candidatus Paceibacterota bacterium]
MFSGDFKIILVSCIVLIFSTVVFLFILGGNQKIDFQSAYLTDTLANQNEESQAATTTIKGGLSVATTSVKLADLRLLSDFSAIKQGLLSSGREFWEANLASRQLVFYQEGKEQLRFPLLRRGDASEWGGTPLGLYDIKSKDGLVFSAAADTWMPYSMKFYGKYYVHGEPYYENGQKYSQEFSGGCVELTDSDTKKVFNSVVEGTPFLVIDQENDGYQYQNAQLISFPEISAESFMAADIGAGLVLAEKNSQAIFPIGEITQLMMAAVMVENTNLRKSVVINGDILQNRQEDSVVKIGQRFPVVGLFYPLLMETSYNAARALGYFWGHDQTLALMNEKAGIILMPNTYFADLSGQSSRNISTAQDLFYLTKYVFQTRPTLFQISRGQKVRTFGPLPFSLSSLQQNNIFPDDTDFLGGKTASKTNASQSGVFVFQAIHADGKIRKLAIIVLGSANLLADTEKIYQWTKASYFSN